MKRLKYVLKKKCNGLMIMILFIEYFTQYLFLALVVFLDFLLPLSRSLLLGKVLKYSVHDLLALLFYLYLSLAFVSIFRKHFLRSCSCVGRKLSAWLKFFYYSYSLLIFGNSFSMLLLAFQEDLQIEILLKEVFILLLLLKGFLFISNRSFIIIK